MKRIFTLVLFFLLTKTYAQVSETEPNGSFSQADTIHLGSLKTGSVNNLTVNGVPIDQYDYFRAVFPHDGTLKIYVTGINQHAQNGYLYLYGFDRRQASGQVLGKYIADNANVTPGASVNDVITVHGRAADTFYFRLETSGVFSYSLAYDMVDTSTNDAEPNDDFPIALAIGRLEEKQGHIGYIKGGVTDQYDVYKTVLPFDGTLKIFVQGANKSGTHSYLYLYGFDRRQIHGQVLSKYIGNNASVANDATIYDTILVHGRAADTFYFRFQSGGAFQYSFRYDVVDTSENDTEPNDDFTLATAIATMEEKKGHISYMKNGGSDNYDYYQTILPVDGTLKVYVEGTNQSGGSGYLYLYGFDKRKEHGQVFGTYIGGNANVPHGASVSDSITIYGVLADTFYFRIQAGGAFQYKIRYTVIQNSDLDQEPNNTFAESLFIQQGVSKVGQIGYTTGGNRDNYDYYSARFPADGTLKVIVQGTNNGGTNGWLHMYGFDRRQASGQVFGKYIANNANVPHNTAITDTFYIHGRAADSFYFRFESSSAFSYKFSYDIVDTSENDLEPNNTFVESNPIERQEEKKGHIGYIKAGAADQYDYYRAVFMFDGTLRINVRGANRSGATGYLFLYGFDQRRDNGQVLGRYIGNVSNVLHNDTVSDVITIHGRAADTFYFRFQSSGAFQYQFSYELIDTSANDQEPNNTFAESIQTQQGEVKQGHVGYVKRGASDQNDYYRTVLPSTGTLKIFVQGVNKSGTHSYLYLYGFDRRQINGLVLSKYIANNASVANDVTIYDTILVHGRAADTFYFQIQSGGAFQYSFRYEMIDTADTDFEPNNSFDEANTMAHLEIKKGNVGYFKSGVSDQYDVYKTVLPEDGTMKVYVQGRNNGGSSGYLFLYGFDRRRESGQVFGRYIANNANVPHNTTIYDTFYVHCRAADTFYFRFQSGGAISYQFKYEMVDVSENDLEPNNTFETSVNMILDSNHRGHIGYIKGGSSDNVDYYKAVLPARGNVKLITEIVNTSGSNGYVYIYVYDRRKGSGQLLEKYLGNNANVAPGTMIRDTIQLNCITTDTLYVRITSSVCFRYTVKTQLNSLEPNAEFDYTRVGNTFGFSMLPQSKGTSYLWNLGNGTTTTKTEPPLTTYGPGFYQVKLIAYSNLSGCSFTDTATRSFTVRGIERYTPHVGGPGNILFTVYGGGLDSNVTFRLTQGSKVYVDSITKVNVNGNIYTAVVDLHDAPAGFYDVDIITSDSTYHYPNGFKLEALKDYLRVEIIGREIVRVNTDNFYTVRVYNEGNTVSGVSTVYLLTPPNITVTELDSLLPIAATIHVNPDTLPHVLQVTTGMGFPINGNIRGFYVAGIPQGGFIDIRFKFNFQPGVNDVYAWSTGPMNGSPDRPWLSDCWKARIKYGYSILNFGLDLIPGVDCAWNAFKFGLNSLSFLATGFMGMFNDGYDISASYTSVAKSGMKTAINCGADVASLTIVGAPTAQALDFASDLSFNSVDVYSSYTEWNEKCDDKPIDKNKRRTDARTAFDPNAKVGPSGYTPNRYINGKDRLMNYTVFFENLESATLPSQTVIIYDTLDKNVFDLSTFNVGSFGIGYNTFRFAFDRTEYVSDVNISSALAIRVNMKLDTATGILTTTFKTMDRATGDITSDPLAGFLPPNTNKPEGEGYITYSVEMKEGLANGTTLKNKATIIFDENAPIATEEWVNTLDLLAPASNISSVTPINDTTAAITITGSDVQSGVEYYQLYVSRSGGAYLPLGKVRGNVNFIGARGTRYDFYVLAVDSVGNIESKGAVSEGTITFPGTPLPVTMTPLKGLAEINDNRLYWSTLSEQNNQGFAIERSANGREFSTIGFVSSRAANGNSSNTIMYEFVDGSAPQKAYYRLKQTDRDNRFVFSNTIYLDRKNTSTVTVYPNPASNELFVRTQQAIVGLRLMDMSGRVVKQLVPNPTGRYSIADIQAGTYILQVNFREGSEQVKLMVQHK